MKYKFILFLPGHLKSPVKDFWFRGGWAGTLSVKGFGILELFFGVRGLHFIAFVFRSFVRFLSGRLWTLTELAFWGLVRLVVGFVPMCIQ